MRSYSMQYGAVLAMCFTGLILTVQWLAIYSQSEMLKNAFTIQFEVQAVCKLVSMD